MRCRATFPFVALSSATEPPHERHASALPIPGPTSRCRLSSRQSAAGSDFKRLPKIANPTGVDTEVVSDTRHHAGSVLATSIRAPCRARRIETRIAEWDLVHIATAEGDGDDEHAYDAQKVAYNRSWDDLDLESTFEHPTRERPDQAQVREGVVGIRGRGIRRPGAHRIRHRRPDRRGGRRLPESEEILSDHREPRQFELTLERSLSRSAGATHPSCDTR